MSCGNAAGDLEETPGRASSVTGSLSAGYRPRRSPTAGLPMITEADRPDAAELDRLRKQARRRWVPRIRSH